MVAHGLRLLFATLLTLAVLPTPEPTPPRHGSDRGEGPAISTRRLTRHEPKDRLVWRRALVACAVDPADPLRLTPAERERLLSSLTDYVYARERLFFQQGRLHELLGPAWRRLPPEPGWALVAPEDLAVEEFPGLVRVLRRKSSAPPAPVPYPPNLVEPHDSLGKHHPRPWDPGDAGELTLEELLSLVRAEAGDLPPRQVPAMVAVVTELEVESKRMRRFWLEMAGLARTRERLETVRRVARGLPRDDESLDPLDPAMGYLFRNWDRVRTPP